MRIDKSIALALSSLGFSSHCGRTAILMYHSISNRTGPPRHPYFNTQTTPARFEQHLRWLHEACASVVPLDQWNTPVSAPDTLRVCITFDDGFADFKTTALPLLAAQGFVATMFLPTAFIGTGTELIGGAAHLTWDDVKAVYQQGMSIGSHSVNHRHFDQLSAAAITSEVHDSAEAIQAKAGITITAFSCPYAFPTAHPVAVATIRSALKAGGYMVGVTTKIGTVSPNDDPYTLRRIPMNTDDDQQLFMAKVNGAYNWLGSIQHAVRLTKKALQPYRQKV